MRRLIEDDRLGITQHQQINREQRLNKKLLIDKAIVTISLALAASLAYYYKKWLIFLLGFVLSFLLIAIKDRIIK